MVAFAVGVIVTFVCLVLACARNEELPLTDGQSLVLMLVGGCTSTAIAWLLT